MSKLIPWQNDFSKAFYPSIVVSFVKKIDGSDALHIVVCPGGIEEYPRYIVSFQDVLVFSCLDEGCAPERDWVDVEISDVQSCAWQWIDSPWIRSYEGCNYDSAGNPSPLHHYLIFGGDNIVEVISKSNPGIEEINERRSIETLFAF